MRVGTFLTPERNTAAHNAHSPRTVRRRRCSAVPVATQGQLPAPLAVGPDHQIGNLEVGQCNYVELIDTIFTDVEGVD